MFKIVYLFTFFIGFFPTDNSIIIQSILTTILSGLLIFEIYISRFDWKLLINRNSTFIVLWLSWTILSGFWIINFKNWFIQCLVIYIALFNTFTLSCLCKQKKIKEELISVFILINIIHNIIGWYEFILSNYLLGFKEQFSVLKIIGRVPLSFFYNQNYFAFYILISLIFIVYWTVPKQYNMHQYFKYGLIISNILMIFILRSLGIIVLLFATIAIMLFLQIKSNNMRKKSLLFSFFIGVLGIFLVLIIATPQQLAGLQIRLNLIINSLVITGSKILIGVGAGSMPVYMEQSDLLDTGGYVLLHNWWIGLLVSHGLIFFLWYVYRYIRKIISSYKLVTQYNIHEAKWIFVALIIISVGVFIPDSLFRSTWFWNIMVMISVCLYDLENSVSNKKDGTI